MRRVLWIVVGLAAPFPTPSVQAQAQPEIRIELNKLEPVEDACRIYLLLENRGEVAYDALTLEFVSFGGDGVIDQRLAIDLAPLRARKTAVKLFDLPGAGCAGVKRLLVNDVSACGTGGQAATDCLDRLRLSARGSVELFK
jgi:hypothetical protein